MSNFEAEVERVDLTRLLQRVGGFEGGLDAGQVGVTCDLVAFGDGLGVPNTVKAEGGHGEIFDEDDLSTFGGWLRFILLVPGAGIEPAHPCG